MPTGNLSISLTTQDSATEPLGTYLGSPSISATTVLTSTAIPKLYQANQAATSSVVTLQVNNASLSNAFGTALTYVTVACVVIQNTGAANLVVGAGTHPLFGSDSYTIQPGQTLVVSNVPITVSSTVNIITITPAASTTWKIMILGS